MKKRINLLTVNKYLFIIFFVLLSIIVSLLILSITFFLGIESSNRKVEANTIPYYIKTLLLAPFIETLIFQFIPIEFLKRFINKDLTVIIISSLLFGVAHYFNHYLIRDILLTFFSGLVLAISYVLAKKRSDLNAFIAVSLIHLGYNLFIVILKTIA
jgi:membrane protease YdiL (CAAX protease family)